MDNKYGKCHAYDEEDTDDVKKCFKNLPENHRPGKKVRSCGELLYRLNGAKEFPIAAQRCCLQKSLRDNGYEVTDQACQADENIKIAIECFRVSLLFPDALSNVRGANFLPSTHQATTNCEIKDHGDKINLEFSTTTNQTSQGYKYICKKSSQDACRILKSEENCTGLESTTDTAYCSWIDGPNVCAQKCDNFETLITCEKPGTYCTWNDKENICQRHNEYNPMDVQKHCKNLGDGRKLKNFKKKYFTKKNKLNCVQQANHMGKKLKGLKRIEQGMKCMSMDNSTNECCKNTCDGFTNLVMATIGEKDFWGKFGPMAKFKGGNFFSTMMEYVGNRISYSFELTQYIDRLENMMTQLLRKLQELKKAVKKSALFQALFRQAAEAKKKERGTDLSPNDLEEMENATKMALAEEDNHLRRMNRLATPLGDMLEMLAKLVLSRQKRKPVFVEHGEKPNDPWRHSMSLGKTA